MRWGVIGVCSLSAWFFGCDATVEPDATPTTPGADHSPGGDVVSSPADTPTIDPSVGTPQGDDSSASESGPATDATTENHDSDADDTSSSESGAASTDSATSEGSSGDDQDDRIVVIGDLHSDLDAAREAMQFAGAMDAEDHWIGARMTVVQLGDLIGRSDDEREVVDYMLDARAQASAVGGALHILIGNHEVMGARVESLLSLLEEVVRRFEGEFFDDTDDLCTDPDDPMPSIYGAAVGGRSATPGQRRGKAAARLACFQACPSSFVSGSYHRSACGGVDSRSMPQCACTVMTAMESSNCAVILAAGQSPPTAYHGWPTAACATS